MSSSSPHLSPQRHHHHHHHHHHIQTTTGACPPSATMANGTANNSQGGGALDVHGSPTSSFVSLQPAGGVSGKPAANSNLGSDDDPRCQSLSMNVASGITSQAAVPFPSGNINQIASCCASSEAVLAGQKSVMSEDVAGSVAPSTTTSVPQQQQQPPPQAEPTSNSAICSSISQVANSTNASELQYRPQQQQQPPTPSHQPKQQPQATGNVLTMINPDTRTHVVGELYDTERSYVESLQILIEKYMKPLKSQDSNKALIDSNLVDEIFYTIPEILEHHENFLDALQDRLSSDWDSSQVIGNVFIQAFTNQQIIDTYTKFINNWKNARHAIKVAIQAKPAFERFLEAMSREHRNKLTLDALLIMPVQRIPRYELLIKELIKHTPQDHPDHGPLKEAQQKIHELALKIDRAEREMLHQEQLKDLEALIENHAGLIQHPHRDFIRYDRVTISTSTLTVARKERVLFLFCDLLIMTSVKKKVSRRSNLQAAFANSDHDISLLEGNKFKLIMRLSLDQVEIRCDNNEQTQLWQQQQQIHEQKLLALAKHKKLIQDKKRELENDLQVLQQMELLSGQLVDADKKTALNVNLTNSIEQILNKLNSLELQQSDCENYPNMAHRLSLQQSAQDSYLIQAPIGIQPATTMAQLTLQQNQHGNNPSQNSMTREQLSSSALNEQDQHQSSAKHSDASLEFIINNDANAKDLSGPNSNTSSKTLNETLDQIASSRGSGHNLTSLTAPDGQQQQHNANCETLVVSFPSRDRRQAFIQAFLDAKQQRLKQQQKKMFSSSVTLKLSQPDQPLLKSRSIASDMRRTRLQHQDEVQLELRANNSLGKNLDKRIDDHRISSAPCAGTIGRCASCSSNYTQESTDRTQMGNRHTSSHHHHQLMHQPASHPALLHTICCHEQHSNNGSIKSLNDETNRLVENTGRPLLENNYGVEINQPPARICFKDGGGQCDNSIVSLLENDMNKCNQILMLKFVPRFITAMPMTFLNTQHPALQISCSVLRKSSSSKNDLCNQVGSIFELGDKSLRSNKRQTFCDDRGQLWLCLSNGYVSHISLVQFVTRDCEAKFNEKASKHCYSIIPLVKSGGDICKSQINCAAQVCWLSPSAKQNSSAASGSNISESRRNFNLKSAGNGGTKTDSNTLDKIDHKSSGPLETQSQPQPPPPAPPLPEVSIKSASPPVNVEPSHREPGSKRDERFISTSAPANSEIESMLDGLEPSRLKSSTTSALDATKEPIDPTSSGAPTNREGQKGVPKKTIHHRYQPHHHHHSQDQIRCRAHRCTPSLPCNQGGYRRYRAACSSPANVQPKWSNQACNQPPTHGHHYHGHQGGPHHHHHHHHHHVYSNRHHTVSIGELRRALERQSKLSDDRDQLSLPDGGVGGSHKRHHLAPPANTPNQIKGGSLDLMDSTRASDRMASKVNRSNTPPARHISAGTRTKQLRHQASLKTSSILAKLVSSAGRGSSYLKRSAHQSSRAKSDQSRNPSDMDENETDTDQQNSKAMRTSQGDNTSSTESNQSIGPPPPPPTVTGLNPAQSNSVVSPLSSVSSLNSSNSSSLVLNSVCVSTPMHGSCTHLCDHSQWPTCCTGSNHEHSFVAHHQSPSSRDEANNGDSFRSRSATVPCRAYCEQSRPVVNYQISQIDCPGSSRERCTNESYKVNEIIDGFEESANVQADVDDHQMTKHSTCSEEQSSLWLGCEDGSLIIIDCLATTVNQPGGVCGVCNEDAASSEMPMSNCQNVHSELRLGASISDIKNHMDRIVFVALADGRLAVFSRATNEDGHLGDWLLESPQIMTVTANELNLTSKLCLIDEDHLWYSYGRNIFVFDISTLTLKTTIMTPTNDKSIQFAMQTVTIDDMEVVPQLNGVWVSFRGSPLIQFYESREYKLLLEMSLLESINKVLSCGNEIIRQHKTACLGATSLLSLYNEAEESNSLFIGTTAGLILVLTISQDRLREQVEAERLAWNPQVISLRHGHSGQVKFLQIIEPISESKRSSVEVQGGGAGEDNELVAGHTSGHERNNLILVSGGSGLDLYGPNDNQQIVQHDDSLNHLVLWSL